MATTDEVRLSYLKWRAQEDIDEAKDVHTRRLYYDGDHPTFLTDRQKEFINLNQADRKYSDNYCKDVVDILAERLSVSSFTVEGEDQQPASVAWQWWQDNKADSMQDELYIAALRDQEAYIIVSYDNENQRPRWTINQKAASDNDVTVYGMRLHRHPDTDDPVFASKRWQSWDPLNPGSKVREMRALYFPDRVELYTTPDRLASRFWQDAGWMPFIERDPETGERGAWPIWWTDDGTEFGEPLGLPVIPFTNPGGSEITTSIISLQDALNKSELDLIAAADMAGFPIAWASGVDPSASIKFAPGRLLRIPSSDASLGRIEGANMTPLLDTCSYFQHGIGSRARIPLYLLQKWGATPPSGESLKTQEGGVISKSIRKQKDFGESWKQVIDLSTRLDAAFGAGIIPEDIHFDVHWELPYSRSVAEMREEAEAKEAAGVPQEQILVEVWGYTPVEAAKFVAEGQARSDQVIGQTMLNIFGAGNDNTEPAPENNGTIPTIAESS